MLGKGKSNGGEMLIEAEADFNCGNPGVPDIPFKMDNAHVPMHLHTYMH